MPKRVKIPLILGIFLITNILGPVAASAGAVSPKIAEKIYGINRSGAEFGADKLPGAEGTDFIYAADAENLAVFAGKGLTFLRVPFLWERAQPKQMGPLTDSALKGLGKMLDEAQSAHMKVILDLHNYGRYYNKPLEATDADALADVWQKLLAALGNKPALYGIELMNEPHDMPGGSSDWKIISQKTIDAIRTRNTKVVILAPGYGWQSARFWEDNNSDYVLKDPAGKLLYAAHQYFDKDFSGTYNEQTTGEQTKGTELLIPFITWLSKHNAKGILTEYGVPGQDKTALAMTQNMLYTVDNNDTLVGAIYWASGPWWGDYPLSIEPEKDGVAAPQFTLITNFPTRTNPARSPSGIARGNFVQFKNNPTIFRVEENYLRPFGSWDSYQKALKTDQTKKLYKRIDAASFYTIRWRTVEDTEKGF